MAEAGRLTKLTEVADVAKSLGLGVGSTLGELQRQVAAIDSLTGPSVIAGCLYRKSIGTINAVALWRQASLEQQSPHLGERLLHQIKDCLSDW